MSRNIFTVLCLTCLHFVPCAAQNDGTLSANFGMTFRFVDHFDFTLGISTIDKVPFSQRPATWRDDWTTDQGLFTRMFGGITPDQIRVGLSQYPALPPFQQKLLSGLPDLLKEKRLSLPTNQDIRRAVESQLAGQLRPEGSVFDVVIPSGDRRAVVDDLVLDFFRKKTAEVVDFNKYWYPNQVSARAYGIAQGQDTQLFEPYINGQRQVNQQFGAISAQRQTVEWKAATEEVARAAGPSAREGTSPSGPVTKGKGANTPLRRPELLDLSKLLYGRIAASPQQQEAWRIAHDALGFSQEAFEKGLKAEYDQFISVSKVMNDITIGFIPIVGPSRDAYQAISGKSLIDGRPLTSTERTICVASVVTLGIISEAPAIMKGIRTLARNGEEIARVEQSALQLSNSMRAAKMDVKAVESLERVVSTAGTEAKQQQIMNDLSKNIFERQEQLGLKLHVEEVQDVGYDNWKAIQFSKERPYADGSWALKGTIEASPEGLVRVTSDANDAKGVWITHKNFVENRTATEIQTQVLNLPKPPVAIADVRAAIGTPVRVSIVGPNKYGTGAGALQIEILDLTNVTFGVPKKLP